MKRFDVVEIINEGDTHFGKTGVIISISRLRNYPYTVCFGCDCTGDPITTINRKSDLKKKDR